MSRTASTVSTLLAQLEPDSTAFIDNRKHSNLPPTPFDQFMLRTTRVSILRRYSKGPRGARQSIELIDRWPKRREQPFAAPNPLGPCVIGILRTALKAALMSRLADVQDRPTQRIRSVVREVLKTQQGLQTL